MRCSGSVSGRRRSTTRPSVSGPRCGLCGTPGGMKKVSPSRTRTSLMPSVSRMRTVMSPFSWMKNSSLSVMWKSLRAFGPAMTITKKSLPL